MISIKLTSNKAIAMVAHDHKKTELIEWAIYNKKLLATHQLFATGTTGALLEVALEQPVTKYLSGPLGGDQQIGAQIAEGRIDVLIFFLGPDGGTASRSGCKGIVAPVSYLQHTGSM